MGLFGKRHISSGSIYNGEDLSTLQSIANKAAGRGGQNERDRRAAQRVIDSLPEADQKKLARLAQKRPDQVLTRDAKKILEAQQRVDNGEIGVNDPLRKTLRNWGR